MTEPVPTVTPSPDARPAGLSIGQQLRRLIVLSALPFVALIGMLGYFGYQDAHRNAEAFVRRQATSVALETARLVDETQRALRLLAARPDVQRMDPAHCDRGLRDLIAIQPRFVNVTMTDREGWVICGAMPPSRGPRSENRTDREWFQAVRAGQSFSMGVPRKGSIVGHWIVTAGAPVRRTNGEFVGAVALSFDLAAWQPSGARGVLPREAVLGVIDKDGTLVLRYPEGDKWVGRNGRDTEIFARLLKVNDGAFDAPGVLGFERIWAVTPVRGTDWLAFAGIGKYVALAPSLKAAAYSVVMAVAALLIAAWLAVLASRRLAQPIAEIARAVRTRAAGGEELIPVAGPVEVEEVARELNHLILARRRAEEVLRESEERYRLLVDLAPEAIIVQDIDTREWVDCNANAEQLFGRSRSDILKSGPQFFYSPDQPDGRSVKDTSDEHYAALSQGKTLMFERSIRNSGGHDVQCEVRLVRIPASGRNLVRGSFVDITERKRSESIAEQYRSVIHASIDGFWITDVTGRILDANNAICKISGYSREELLRLSISDIEADESPEETAAHIREMVRTGHVQFEARHRRKDGSVIGVEVSVLHVPELGARLFAFVRDITGRKQAEAARAALEAQLREAQKMEAVGILAGGIAHDFNNILAAIRGNAMLAKNDVRAHPEDALVSLTEIDKAATRATNLVQQILTFSRKNVQTFAVQQLRSLVEETIKLLRATIPAGVNISASYEDAPLYVRADATQMQQVLMNLCTNAWQAMAGNSGRIEIEVHRVLLDAERAQALGAPGAGSYARLAVADDGCGMDEGTQARIFEPFYTTKTVGQGTGLGLSVVHGIVQGHHGGIEVRSAPGKGTTLAVYLPISAAQEATQRLPEPKLAQGSGQRVLYVDDEESMVFLVQRMLDYLGYRTSGCISAKDAVATVRAKPDGFDLVVSDYNMPEMSGLDVAREVRRIRSDLPVVLTSGYVTEQLRAEALQAGVRQVVYKPNTVDELCHTIGQLLTTPRGEA